MSKISNWATKKYIEYQTRDEEAQGLAEYGLILALIAVACVVALGLLGDQISGVLGSLNFGGEGGETTD